jgi:glycosyltransferase involved in cell wall biosynthesis
MLLLYARQLGVGDVEFAGAVPQAALNAYYGAASLSLCMSEHEGFCIPMIESLVHRVPVLAYAAGAVPETLDGAGILFREKNYPAIAEMMGRLCRDEPLRAAMLRRQDERLARYEARDLAAELRNLLSPVLPPIR